MVRIINNPITQLTIDSPPKMYERVIIVIILTLLVVVLRASGLHV